jgi:OPA family sugar phosphate sensor protein UhpC-like MFS transporter
MTSISVDTLTIKRFNYWRMRTFYSIFLGYIFYYFTRKSFTFAAPALVQELGFEKTDIGLLVSIFAIAYGISKFVCGIIGDRSNPRYFMACGLIMTGILNICFGLSNSLFFFIVFWALNGVLQGCGWPPCARLLTYWYSPLKRGTWWAIWSTSHNIGGAVIPLIVAASIALFNNWRFGFYVPGILCIVMGFFVMERLRDTPRSVNLPSAEKIDDCPESETKDAEKLSIRDILFRYVLFNKYIWFLSLANFFVYIIRTCFNDWMILYFHEERGFSILEASATIPWFEGGGIVGMLIAGFISDRVFFGNRGVISFLFMAGLIIPSAIFLLEPSDSYVLNAALMFFVGLFLFGPQMLIGCAAAENSHKDAAATASGFAGTFGYLGSAAAGWPIGFLIERFAWRGFFMVLLCAAFLGALCFLPFFRGAFKKMPIESPV